RAPPARLAAARRSRGRAGPAACRSCRGGSCVAGEDVVGDLLEGGGAAARLCQGGPRLAVRLRGELASLLQAEDAHVSPLPVTLVGPLRLSERRLVTRYVEDVVDDLEEDAQLRSEPAIGKCGRFRHPR